MPRSNIYLATEEDDKIKEYSQKWKVSKEETIKRMIREFREDN